MNRFKTLSALIITAALFAILPALSTAPAAYASSEIDFYADSAAYNGLIPSNMMGALDEEATWSDLIDFMLNFSKVKSGVDVDALLSRARATTSSEDAAKIKAINELLGEEIISESQDPEDAKKYAASVSVITYILQLTAQNQIVPFSPLMYDANNSWPEKRYNFINNSSAVYNDEVLVSLMREIMSFDGAYELTDASTMTRRQLAAYCYMFSTMSLPKDPSGKYPGGVSGYKELDNFIAAILDNCVSPAMTDEQKVKAIYDYMIYNFTHDADAMPLFTGSSSGSANPLEDAVQFAMPIVASGQGTCDVFANVFRLLALRLGFECNYVSGQYVNTDGSSSGHGWNQIKINDEWYWLDVDVEGTVFHRGSNAAPLYFLFMKKDSEWTSNHRWDRANWPAADGSKHPVLVSAGGSDPEIPPPVADSAIKVVIDGKLMAFDVPPQIVNDRTLVPLRVIFEELGATIEWDDATQTVTAVKDGTVVVLTIGSARPTVNGQVVVIDQPGIIVDGRTLAPLRFVAEAFGGTVEWDGGNQTAYISR